jgi:hypothetical protein
MLRTILIGCCFTLLAQVNAQLLSPSDFLPHEHGQQFTPHHLVVDYVQHVAEQSPRVQVQQYGQTYEDRPLLLAAISSPENMAELEAIRLNHLRRAGLADGEVDPALDRAIVWLSFGVHGNEAGATESSMSVLYQLAKEDEEQVKEWLKNTIVLLDPSLNPDGYSRYVHWYRGIASQAPAPERYTREHREPWPGGRVNHYLFDLNRDWAWQTQQETQSRLATFKRWLPHIHVDYHEQYPDNPYYFAPAASPYHEYIADWQEEFQYTIGKNNASYFDRNGWLYFTREAFDLLYPSYGDTYPTFNGGIGMTYEQAGHGISGRQIIMENEDTLTLQDRIDHHTATALSTVEVAAKKQEQLVEQFADYFKKAQESPTGQYKSFVISRKNKRGRLAALLQLLDRNGIEYQTVRAKQALQGFCYEEQTRKSITVEEGDLLISAYQPMSVLAQVLFEPEPKLEDSLTYDITAWALPYAYGLEAAAFKQRITGQQGFELPETFSNLSRVKTPYAYLLPWNAFSDAQFVSALMKAGIRTRTAGGAFSLEGNKQEAGTIIITQADNRKMADFHQQVKQLARKYNQDLQAVRTGFSDDGFDLGSGGMAFMERPQVAVLGGEKVSPNSYGEVWHFFEHALQYPLYHYETDDLERIEWDQINTLILPEGRYDFKEKEWEMVSNWVQQGGRIIFIGQAIGSLPKDSPFQLEQPERKAEEGDDDPRKRVQSYGDLSRRYISNSLPGAILKADLDITHPLAYGLGEHYFSLKTDRSVYALLKSGWNVGHIGESPEPIGFVGENVLKQLPNTLSIGHKSIGRGDAVYLVDNPLFRGFWEQGKLLFSNAVFMP